ncbi:MAG TPA: NAD(P)/FAD-dependent oxidoreductase, partial [Nitrospirales bacterium]|nr:NAD(P)/FAD-dependent oxidoreductase [Nitrospirales bacterium]
DKEVCLSLNCFPQFSIRDIEQWIVQSTSQRGKKTIASLLSERLPARLALKIAEFQKPNISQLPVNLLNKEARSKLILSLTNLRLPILGSRGWNFAEVTAGGIPLEEIHPNSMESRLIPGLYVIGEMLDCDGRIGGFNFQWAWATGYIAGTSAGLAVTKSITQEVQSP